MNTGSTTIDERIVEMRIDNEKFEAGAKKTISILENLDRSLNKIGSDNVDGFTNIEKSLDKVTDRFSAMGIVGDQVMRNITNRAMEVVGQLKHMSTMLTTQQIGAGWDKYAGKVEAVQTIMASTNNLVGEGLKWADQEEQLAGVTEQLQRLTWFADETSYSFSDMVNNVGKFTAAGRDLEESVTAMQGISTWAAISGGRPAEAGRAMYNLSQALGLGAVTQIDWKSIELANMATYEFKQQVIDVAEQMGTLKRISEDAWETAEGHTVTIESFRENLKDKWFNSDVLLEVLNNYGGFAQLVADVQDTFDYDSATYVLSDLKNYEKMLEGDAEATEELRKSAAKLGITIDDLKGAFDEMLRPEYDLGRRAFQAAQEAKTFQEAIDATRDAVSTKWMDVFEALFGNYLEAKELWTKMSEVMWNIFARPVDHLLKVITNARGFMASDGIAQAYSEGMNETIGTTEVLEDRLTAIGKTMGDLRKAFEKTMDATAVEQMVKGYGSFEEALKHGAFTFEQFQIALGALDDSFDPKKPTTLNRALNKAGKTAADFEKALRKAMDQKDVVQALEKYSSLEDAFRNGAISVEDFKEALNSLGIDSENVTEEIQETVKTGVGNIAEMRELALEVLRGDHGNGAERMAWYESMGLDPEVMQAMVGDLSHLRRAWYDDDYLMEIMEMYWQAQNLSARLGYATFAEYLASCTGATEEYVYDMNNMANEAENIYASLFGSGVVDEYGNLISAGELFRKSLTNLLDALSKFGDAFDEAFLKVFGGSDTDNQIYNMSDGFFTLTAAFYSFSERVKAFSESTAFLNFMEAFFSIIRVIGKVLSFVFKIGRTGLSVIFKLLSPIFTLLTSIFEIISTGIDGVSRGIEEIGIFDKINEFSNEIVKKIEGPINNINKVITAVVDAFKKGFDEGGFEEGLLYIGATLDAFFENSPVALTIIHALEKAFSLLATAISTVVSVAGGLFGGAVMAVISVFSTIIDWIGKLILWAKDSEIINAIWDSIAETFTKVGNVLKRVFGKGGYAEQGFEEGGFIGAFNAVVDSVERGVTRLVPGGEKIASIIETLRNVFKKKSTDENGVERMVDNTENELLSLEETFSGGFFANLIRGASGDDEAKEAVGEGVSGLVDSAWQGFLNALRNIRISDVIDALKLGVIADVLFKVGHGLNIINGLADNIADIPDRFNDMLEDLGQMFRSIAVNFQMTAIKQLGVGILLIAGSIWILSRIPQEQLEKASSTVMTIILLLTLLVKALVGTSANMFKNLAGLPALGLALIGLASTIAAIGTTVLILAAVAKFIGTTELMWAVGAIIAIIAAIGILVVRLVKAVNSKGFNGWQIEVIGSMLSRMGLGLMGLALSIQMLLVPIVVFCGILKLARGKAGIRKFWMAIGAVVSIMLGIGAMVWLISQATNGFTAEQIGQLGNFILKVGAAMILMAAAMAMLTTPILLLAAAQKILGLNINGIIGALTMFGLIGLLITGILAISAGAMSNKAEAQIKATGNYLLKFAASMVLMSVALALLAKPVIKIAELTSKIGGWNVVKSLVILLATIGILAGILALIGKLFKGKNAAQSLGFGKGLFKIAAGIAMLALAAFLLAPAIVLLTGAIAAFTYALGRMDDDHWLVFENGLDRLKKFAKPLMLFGAALAVVGLAATLTGTGLVAMAGGIFLLAAALALASLGLPYLVEAFERLEKLNKTELNWSVGKLAIIVGGLCLGLLALGFALKRISTILNLGAFKGGIGKRITKLVTDLRSGVSNGFTKTIEFLKDPKNKEALTNAIAALIIIGAGYVAGLLPTLADTIIGGLVGLLNAVADAISNHAPGIVEALNNIVKSLVKVAAALIDELTGLDTLGFLNEHEAVLDRIAGILEFTAAAAGIATLIKKFRGLKTIISGAGGVVEAIGGATDGVGSLQSVASMTDEIMIGLTGSSESFVATIASAVGPFLLIALAIAGIAKGMHDLANGEGWWESVGEAEKANDIEIFGEDADTAEKKVNELDNTLSEHKKLLEAAAAAKQAYIDAQDSDDIDDIFAKQEEWEAAEQALLNYESKYYEAISRLATEISGEDFGTKHKEAFDAIIAGTIESTEMYQHWLETRQQVADSTDDLTNTTKQLSETEELRSEQIERRKRQSQETVAATQAETAAVEEETTAVGGLFDLLFSASDTLKEYGLSDLFGQGKDVIGSWFGLNDANGVKEFLKSKLSFLGDTSWIDQISSEDLKSIGSNIIDGIGDGADSTEAKNNIISILEEYGDIIPDTVKKKLGIESPSTVMRDEVGQYIPAGIGKGIDKFWYTAVNPLYMLMDEMSYVFHNIREKFVGHGAQIVQGIIDGIQANYLAARQVAVGLAVTINEGLRDELDMHSPSRTMYENGVNIVKGVSEGMSHEVSASLWGTKDISDSLTDFLYDQTKKVVEVFSILNVGAAMRIKKTRKEIFEGLGDAPEDYILALERLAQKEQEVQNQIDLTPKTRDDEKQRLERINQIYDQLGSVLLPELAYKLGITTEAFYAQLEAANGNIFEIKAMQEYLAQYAQTAEDLRLVDTSIPAEEATRSADNMYTGITDPFEQIDAVFDTYGAEAAYGLVRGILENIYQAYQSGSDLAAALENGFTEYLKIESPSRVFAELARYIPLGIGKGIDQESDSAISSVVVLSDALMDAILQSMAMVSTVADEDFEFTPRITPVVDLTDVDSAASYMGEMFGGNYGMSAQMSSAISKRMAAAERIASNMATTQTINNGDNITFNIYQQPGEDANALADAVLARMNTRLARRGVAFG